MKLKGKTINPPKSVPIPVIREDGDIILLAAPLMDYKEFDSLCPEPKAPLLYGPNRRPVQLTDSPEYRQSMERHSEMRTAYTIVKSLQATPDLTWETVDITNPDTWLNYKAEMATHFTVHEVGDIISSVLQANMPSEERREEALRNFMSPLVVGDVSDTSKTEEPVST